MKRKRDSKTFNVYGLTTDMEYMIGSFYTFNDAMNYVENYNNAYYSDYIIEQIDEYKTYKFKYRNLKNEIQTKSKNHNHVSFI